MSRQLTEADVMYKQGLVDGAAHARLEIEADFSAGAKCGGVFGFVAGVGVALAVFLAWWSYPL
jgi:hypothetical protein